MTEEIIIDGVDVAGCNFRLERDNKQKCECCYATGFGVIYDCNIWHTCYYKQLQRAKAEIEEIKKIKDDFFKQAEISHQAVLDKNKIIENLETENERLKAENNKLRNDYYSVVDRLADVTEAYNSLRRKNGN